MKYFAKLGLNSKVIGITHVGDNNAPTEEAGIEYLNKLHSYPFWKEFKKDGSIRKNPPAIGMTYDEDRDAFIYTTNPTIWSSSVFNEDTCQWEHPIPHPDDHKIYHWDEETISWKEGVGIN
jgi:hypothetical protein